MIHDKDEGIGFLKGFLIGGSLATVLTLLYAPKSGEKFRKDIRKTSKKWINEAEDQFDDLQDRADSLAKEIEDRLNKIKKQTDKAVEDLKKKSSDMGSSVADKFK